MISFLVRFLRICNMVMKRSGKFYRKNEAEVMRALGLKPIKNSRKEEANET